MSHYPPIHAARQPQLPTPLLPPAEPANGTINRRTVKKAAVHDLSMEYIAKKIPTREEKLIANSRMIDLPKLRQSNQESITRSVTDGRRRWLVATSKEKTEIIKTQTTQDLNAERIPETALKKIFFEGCANTKNLSPEQTKQLTERFFEGQVNSGEISQEQAAFFY